MNDTEGKLRITDADDLWTGVCAVETMPAPRPTGLLGVYRSMRAARVVDEVEAEMTASSGESFFHVSGAGHEGSEVLNPSLTCDDWLHLHYRDKALLLTRGVLPEIFVHSALCNGASHSAGRQMCTHMSDPGRSTVLRPDVCSSRASVRSGSWSSRPRRCP
jgi:TPP-dependent pyruvate/acetoin dehydrogenase alpha subunit